MVIETCRGRGKVSGMRTNLTWQSHIPTTCPPQPAKLNASCSKSLQPTKQTRVDGFKQLCAPKWFTMHQNSSACLPNAAPRVNMQSINPAGNLNVYSSEPAPLSPQIMRDHALATGRRVVPTMYSRNKMLPPLHTTDGTILQQPDMSRLVLHVCSFFYCAKHLCWMIMPRSGHCHRHPRCKLERQ